MTSHVKGIDSSHRVRFSNKLSPSSTRSRFQKASYLPTSGVSPGTHCMLSPGKYLKCNQKRKGVQPASGEAGKSGDVSHAPKGLRAQPQKTDPARKPSSERQRKNLAACIPPKCSGTTAGLIIKILKGYQTRSSEITKDQPIHSNQWFFKQMETATCIKAFIRILCFLSILQFNISI